ncbi:tyrosine-type recombinase/integrase [Mesorhizobium sp. AaZ16]|uniref:tyrosine-type recombinase/integrase n=1 Tax=Mesorhizobium sp. AaZ16 TaxID=3402289 RepID=UPI00374FD684
MTRTLHKLSDVSIKAEKKPGRHSDGGGLYLNVSPSGSKSWLFMWTRDRKRREMGLGSYPVVTLAKARSKAGDCRAAVEEGKDPIAEKAKEAEPTFGECADRYIASIKTEWRNAKHEYQWNQTLTSFCETIRPKRVSEIKTDDVLKVLTPIWQEKNETASRLRGRIERVLDYAKVKGWRSGENPAVWRGHLRNILPKRQKLQRGHLPAMPYVKIPVFVRRLRTAEAMAARALEFTILTVARSGEVTFARWPEIDFDKKLWNVPKERMKAGKPHTVPLSDRATELLEQLSEARTSEFIFPGERKDMPLSNMAMLMLLRRLKVNDITVHGFRSGFRDWCGDETSFPREVAEAALAHKVGNEVERAYRRSDALEKRRKLMQAWADYLEGTTSTT